MTGLRGVAVTAPRRRDLTTAAHAAIPIVAAIAWFIALARVETRDVGDLGLVSALPVEVFLVLGIAAASFAGAVAAREPSERLALLHVLALIAMLYGATGAVAEVPSFHVTWRHAGVAEYIAEHGSVDRAIDAYFNWPGFFALAASASELAGLDNPVGLARYAPVVFNLLYLPPLVVIARSVTRDERAVWTGVWIFFATNWVGQDYFAPQAAAYALYLVLLALLLTWFAGPPRPGPRTRMPLLVRIARAFGHRLAVAPLRDAPLRARQRIALAGACAIVAVATVVTHQLTPFAMLVVVAAMVIVGRCSLSGLPLFILVAVGGWVTFAAGPFLAGHIEALKGEIGQVGSTLSASVGDRVRGSGEHTAVVYVRIALAVFVWALAIAGAVSLLRRRTRWPTLALILLAPLTLVVLQGYGGEIVLRVYMFALPFAAVFAGILIAPSQRRVWLSGLVAAAAATLLLAGFLFARYGNERINLFTRDELAVVDRLYGLAPEGSVLVSANPNVPWQGRHYADYDYLALSRRLPDLVEEKGRLDLADETAWLIEQKGGRGFVLFTRSSRAYDELLGEQSWGSAAKLERALAASSRFRRIHANADGAIYELRGGT